MAHHSRVHHRRRSAMSTSTRASISSRLVGVLGSHWGHAVTRFLHLRSTPQSCIGMRSVREQVCKVDANVGSPAQPKPSPPKTFHPNPPLQVCPLFGTFAFPTSMMIIGCAAGWPPRVCPCKGGAR